MTDIGTGGSTAVDTVRRALLRRRVGGDEGTLIDVLQGRAAADPAAPLLLDANRRVTNAGALQESQRIAHLLAKVGKLGMGHTVASFLSHRIDEHLWRLGTNLAGGVYASLNRQYQGNMLRDVLARSRASWLVTERDAWPVLSSCIDPAQLRGIVFVDAIPQEYPHAHPVPALEPGAWTDQPTWGGVRRDPADCASILFTSGTTGRPKAVCLPHNLFVRGGGYLAAAWGLGPRDVFHAWSPAYHIGGQLYQLGLALLAGASCAILPAFSRSRFWDQVDRFGCTFTTGFANVATYLLSAPPSERDASHSLRLTMLAGLSSSVRHTFQARFNLRCVDSYGMTEAEPVACSLPDVSPENSCGPVNPDFQVRLVDEQGAAVACGSVGHVEIRPTRPAVMMLGYATEEVTAAAPQAAEGWFRTHDLARLDAEGNFYFLDREKNALKRSGENVSPREIELTLLACPGVKECAVLGVWNTDNPEPDIKAVIVTDPAATLRAEDVAGYCARELPRYMRPRYIEFVAALAYTHIGKIDMSGLDRIGPGIWDANARGAAGQ